MIKGSHRTIEYPWGGGYHKIGNVTKSSQSVLIISAIANKVTDNKPICLESLLDHNLHLACMHPGLFQVFLPLFYVQLFIVCPYEV